MPEETDLFVDSKEPFYSEESNALLVEEKSPAHYQYKGRYIMTAVKSGLMIIDQQRADIRIRYERYMEQLKNQSGKSQRILFPEAVEFSPSNAVVLQTMIPELASMGFEISDLGGGSFAINGVPAELDDVDPVNLFRSVVSDAIEHGVSSTEQMHASLALSMARHSAVSQGQVLSNDEMEGIVNQLFACSNVNYTPDGRAILCILPQHDIEQMLG
jgi:DNA mismatch repair protein MutL